MLYSVIHFINVDFDFFRMFSFNERNRNMSSAALKFTNINSFDSMDRIKWKSKPHLPQIKDEAARRAKSHILIFYLGKEGVYSNFPFILFKFVAGFDKVKNHPSVRKLRFSTHVFHESHHVYITQPINGNFTSFGFDTFFPVLRSW